MTPFFIHIGYGKTATTWFQEKLFSVNSNINYFGKTEDNYPIWLIKTHYLDNYAFNDEKDGIRKIILSKYNSQPDKISLLSSEPFTNPESIYSQGNRIKELFPNPKIIIFLRNPVSFLKSFYKHNVKEGLFFLDIEQYLDFTRKPFALQKRKLIYLPGLFYDDVIDYYSNLFGRENICILKYEYFQEYPQNFVNELGEFMKIDFGNISELVKEKLLEGIPDKYIKKHKIENFKNYLKKYLPNTFDNVKYKEDFSDDIISPALEKKLIDYFKDKCSIYFND